MDRLFDIFAKKIQQVDTRFVRSLIDEIVWDARLIGIRGARGVGKTTLLLQRIKLFHPLDGSVLYVSVDNIWFAEHKLYDMASDFVKRGGRFLFLDEVHRYPNWSQELKNIYDDFPELNIVFTGSSLLEILNAKSDLSRRAIVYEMQGFSFREYLNFSENQSLPIYTLEQILQSHVAISAEVLSKIKVLKYFEEYLRHGYYPFYDELPSLYYSRIGEVVNLIVEFEIPHLRGVDNAYVQKIKQLLYAVSESAPFVPNITKLSERIGITRNALLTYIAALHDSRLTMNVHKQANGITRLQKPDKIYLENPNLMYALVDNVDIGNVRETFFANQLRYKHELNVSEQSDFLIDGKYTFEVGGRDKGQRQIVNIPDAYIAADNIEYGSYNKIPLWLFGFLY
ncbi:MAG: ATP-binding protein [Prevotella sp.]|nr:ATP-binding protein [Prevotella sp.]